MSARTALVTGAGRGIGQAIASSLLDSGYHVAVWDRQCGWQEPNMVAVQVDITDPVQIAEAWRRTLESLDGVDVLVNNAGVEFRAPIADHTIDDWNRVHAVNLTAPFALAQMLAPHLAGRDHPAIVNVASVAVVGMTNQIAYDSSKGAILTLTRSLATELGPVGVRANAVCPGFISTPMLLESGLERLASKVTRGLPLSRPGTPQEVAAAVRFLASPEASYITGQALFVDGGWIRW